MPGVPQAPLRNGSTPVSRVELVGQQPEGMGGMPTVGHPGERLGHLAQLLRYFTSSGQVQGGQLLEQHGGGLRGVGHIV